jgi:hypothetical protein
VESAEFMNVDTSKWSGEGTFTQTLIDRLSDVDAIEFLRVEDAPASRSEADYNFISNEIFVAFRTTSRKERSRRFGVLPVAIVIVDKMMNISGLQEQLSSMPEVGEPDYSDESMMQYLRTERIVPPYQTRGYKLVELVRIYEVGSRPSVPS